MNSDWLRAVQLFFKLHIIQKQEAEHENDAGKLTSNSMVSRAINNNNNKTLFNEGLH
jgi:hypothetical protein